jgi:ACR3 family arsenite efflux pump ArsB
MKYILVIIGIILSLFGFIIVVCSLAGMIDSASKYPPSTYFVAMVIFGILPLAVGIALCVFAVKKLGKSKVKHLICGKCNRNLEPGWTACPYCGEKVSVAN